MRASVMLVGVVLGLAPESPTDLELRWSAPAQCPDEAAVRAHVIEALTGHDGGTRPVQASATVEAELVTDGSVFQLDLRVEADGRETRRSITSRDCELLARTTGLVVAVALDPDTSADELASVMDREKSSVESDRTRPAAVVDPDVIDAPSRSTTNAGEATPALDVSPPDASTSEGDAPEHDAPEGIASPPEGRPHASGEPSAVQGLVRVFGGAGAGVVPPIDGGVALTLGVRGRRWRVEAMGGRWFGPRETFDGDPDAGADFDVWSGGARGCWVPGRPQIEVPLCGGAELGQIRADGFGAPVEFRTRALWAAAVIAPAVIWLPRRFIGIATGVDIFVNLVRPGFGADERPDLFRTAPAGGRIWVGLEVRAGPRR